MAFKKEEEICAKALENYLKEERNYPAASWKPGPDPPDVDVAVVRPNSVQETWGVEVTALTQYVQKLVKKKGLMTGEESERRQFEEGFQALIRKMDEQYRSELSMTYMISLFGPVEPKVFKDLERRILEYIKSGKSEEVALDHAEAEATVSKNVDADPNDPLVKWALDQTVPQYERIKIMGFPGKGGIVAGSGVSGTDRLPDDSGMVADISASVTYSVNRILAEKLPIIKEKVTGYTRKMLLIWDDLFLGEPSDVAEALAGKVTVDDLDAVFFVDKHGTRVSVVADLVALFV